MNTGNLKKTALYENHIKIKAKMVPFAGWVMPLQYDKITTEHITVREKAGLFDVSHMGQITITGKGALELIQRLAPRDLSKLYEGHAAYTQFCNPNGGIIDDLIVYRLKDVNNTYNFLLIVNAANKEKDLDWILTNINDSSKVQVNDISDENSLIALQGPLASKILEEVGVPDNNQPATFHIIEDHIMGIKCLIARTGYTGEDGFEILVKNDMASQLWNQLLNTGKSYGLLPIGLAARDTLRLEAALPLHGNDINEDITPIEANLDWTVSIDKPFFIGKDAIEKQVHNGTDKVFIGFKMLSQNIPRKGCELFQQGRMIGNTTSGSIAPYLNCPVGLGYVNKNASTDPGTKIEVLIRNKMVIAEIVKLPFYRRKRGK